MRLNSTWLNGLITLFVSLFFLVVDSHSASAQSLRYLNRSVDAGKQIEFQWLNYDDRTCKDNGYPQLVVETAPSLGKYRTKKRKFTQQNGQCKGKRFSVLLVYYVAGRTKGKDSTSFVIRGRNNIRINLKIDVK